MGNVSLRTVPGLPTDTLLRLCPVPRPVCSPVCPSKSHPEARLDELNLGLPTSPDVWLPGSAPRGLTLHIVESFILLLSACGLGSVCTARL